MTDERRDPAESAHAGDPGRGATLGRVVPLVVLGVVLALVAVRAGGLGSMLEVARLSDAEIESDADFFRSEPILGPESPILDRLQRDHPEGVSVALPLAAASVVRGQRFWLALLPTYPIASDAGLVICRVPCTEPGLTLLESGKEFALMRRQAGTARPVSE